MQPYLKRIKKALADLRAGKIIILTDHPDREDEGDFVISAEKITEENINFIIRNSSGIICLSLEEKRINQLGLTWMVPPPDNTSLRGTPFTVSIDARDGITTGVSAYDRMKTIQTAIADHVTPAHLVKPGHIFPLHAKSGGVLERPGHTEGALDLAYLAGDKPAAVLCEVMNPDGTMSRGKQLKQFAEKHHLTLLSIDDIIHYRLAKENLISEEASAHLPLYHFGSFEITVVKEKINNREHIILEKPNLFHDKPLLVRIHSACITGDLFGSLRCDCHQQLQYSLKRISEEGGLIIYLDQEGRGIGLINKIKAYALQEQGLDTIEANQKLGLPIDARSYYMAAHILQRKKIQQIRLLTNNPEKVNDLKKYGVKNIMTETIPTFCNEYNKHYLSTKKFKLKHTIHDAWSAISMM